jgi:hypothetical protein
MDRAASAMAERTVVTRLRSLTSTGALRVSLHPSGGGPATAATAASATTGVAAAGADAGTQPPPPLLLHHGTSSSKSGAAPATGQLPASLASVRGGPALRKCRDVVASFWRLERAFDVVLEEVLSLLDRNVHQQLVLAPEGRLLLLLDVAGVATGRHSVGGGVGGAETDTLASTPPPSVLSLFQSPPGGALVGAGAASVRGTTGTRGARL